MEGGYIPDKSLEIGFLKLKSEETSEEAHPSIRATWWRGVGLQGSSWNISGGK